MLLIGEIIAILVLVTALTAFIIEENKIKKSKVPRGAIKEYWSGQERRQTMRINASFIVRYSIEKKYPLRLNGQMKDISSDGMRLLINEKLAEGTLLLLEFDLANKKDFVGAEGKVIWTDGEFAERDKTGRRIFQTGIQFVSIKPDDKSRLVAYVEKIAKKV